MQIPCIVSERKNECGQLLKEFAAIIYTSGRKICPSQDTGWQLEKNSISFQELMVSVQPSLAPSQAL